MKTNRYSDLIMNLVFSSRGEIKLPVISNKVDYINKEITVKNKKTKRKLYKKIKRKKLHIH